MKKQLTRKINMKLKYGRDETNTKGILIKEGTNNCK